MKKLFFVLLLIVGMTTIGFSQESNLYTFFVNVVSEEFRFPLIGFVNIARGEQKLPQIGLVNWNTNNFSSLQASLVNVTGGNMKGVQAGLVNISAGDVRGTQWGLINTAKAFYGAQLGLINGAKTLKGVQMGLINYVDTVEEGGVPIGLISIVRNGGYHAVEYSFSEFYPVTLGLKLGVEKFYTTISVGYNPSGDIDRSDFGLGVGVGSILPISKSFFINPELNYLSPGLWGRKYEHITSFVPYFGYTINKTLSIAIGPSVSWVYTEPGMAPKQFFKLFNYEINDKNSIAVGARASVRVRF